MLYCKNCMRLTDASVCPNCRSKSLRVPLDADFCMVAELGYAEAEMLKEVFADRGIPCTDRSARGAVITINLGFNLERVRLYVPYSRYAEAAEIRDAYFGGEAVLLPD